jgi:RNA-directed DNA polymerase
MLDVIFTVLDSNQALDRGKIVNMGLPIGYYTSQWFANWFLQDLDHFIKEKLHVKYYTRYVDDIVIFAKNKKELYNKYREIELFLNKKGLSVKNNWKIYNFDYTNKQAKIVGFPIDYMGFKFYRNRTTVRKSIMLKASRKANKISKKLRVTAYYASQLLSYYVWFKHTNTYSTFEKHIRSKVNLLEMKQLIKRRSQLCA